jgi:hypothetical protein
MMNNKIRTITLHDLFALFSMITSLLLSLTALDAQAIPAFAE